MLIDLQYCGSVFSKEKWAVIDSEFGSVKVVVYRCNNAIAAEWYLAIIDVYKQQQTDVVNALITLNFITIINPAEKLVIATLPEYQPYKEAVENLLLLV